MSWFSSFFHGVGSVVHDVVKGVGHAVGDVIHVVGENIVPIVAAIAAYYTAGLAEGAAAGAGSAAASGGAAAGGTAAAAGTAGAAAGTAAGTAAAGVSAAHLTAAAVAMAVVRKITAPVAEVAHVAQQFSEDIYQPIIKPLLKYYDQAKSLYTAVKDSLTQGFRGIMEIPSEIADAFGNMSAIQRHIADVRIEGSATIASKILGPTIINAAHEDLSKIHETISKYTTLPEDHLEQLGRVKLREPVDFSEAAKNAEGWLKAINSGDTYTEKFMAHILGLLFAGPFWIETFKRPLMQLNQELNTVTPLELLDLGSIVEALKRDELSSEQGYAEAAKHGIDGTRLDLLNELAKKLIAPADMLTGFFRGLTTAADTEKELNKQGYTADRVKLLFDLSQKLPSPGDAMLWYSRGILSESDLDKILTANQLPGDFSANLKEAYFSPPGVSLLTNNYGRAQAVTAGYLPDSLGSKPPEDIRKIHRANGYDEDAAQQAWLAHWHDMPLRDWFAAYFRDLITHAELILALRGHNVPPELDDILLGTNQELLPIWMIPDILGTGLVDDAAGTAMLSKLGIDSDNIKIMLDYGKSKGANKLAAHADALHQLSLGNLQELYKQRVIDIFQYQDGLEAHGYSNETAVLMGELIETKQKLAQRKADGNHVVDKYKAGMISATKAEELLYNEGFTAGEVAHYLRQIKQAKVKRSKLPSESQINSMLKAGVIDRAEWSTVMGYLGYDLNWTDKIYELINKGK